MSHEKQVSIYTDGACSGNPGPGGYGAVLLYGEHQKELSQGYRLTTNNRMELLAAIVALETLNTPCRVEVFSDSKYVVNAVSKGWAKKWRARGWKRTGNKRPENVDLWQRLLTVLEKHTVAFRWVKGHAGDPMNERCDQLATAALRSPPLKEDEGYGSAAPATGALGLG
jgi:ribonuclease HI